MRNRTKVLVAVLGLALLVPMALVSGSNDETASPSILELAQWCVDNGGRPEFVWTHVWGNWSTEGTVIETEYGPITVGSGYVDVEAEYVSCTFDGLPPTP